MNRDDMTSGSASFDQSAYSDAVELAGLGVWILDVQTGQVSLSEHAASLYRTSAGRISRREWRAAVLPEDRSRADARLAAATPSQPRGAADLTLFRKGHDRRHLCEQWRVTAWEEGAPALVLGVVSDITSDRLGEERRRKLTHELRHRMKNLLAVVRSIARRTARHSLSVEDFNAHFDGRLAALGNVQQALAHADEGRADLEDIIRQELVQSLGSDQDAAIEGPAVALGGKMAELIALAVHELATNAAKFNPTSTPPRLTIRWELTPAQQGEAGQLVLTWLEAEAARRPQSSVNGFGVDLIEKGLPYELGAEVDVSFGVEGLTCRISLPLPSPAAV